MKKSMLGEQAMVALDADAAGDSRVSTLLAPILKAVRTADPRHT